VAGVLFVVLAWSSIQAFGVTELTQVGEPTSTETIGLSLLGRYVVPFEAVSFVLLAALIGGITIARKDLTPLEEAEKGAV
jgi:NADH:ubiquinone oxidoreductase subunit 6 (subunit J)